jgi:spermidine/putrescine-binding protein
MRVLAWPGMPSTTALRSVALAVGDADLEIVVVSSNERLEELLDEEQPFDLAFPSDYLVDRLRRAGRLLELGALPLERLEPWAAQADYDPGCRHSVPFAFGTTGLLRGASAAGISSWRTMLAPPPQMIVGMLDEAREVVGAALMALGRSPNDCRAGPLEDAHALLLAQQHAVAAYDSDEFCAPVATGRVAVHQAWSGPAAQAVRRGHGLSYVVPDEGAILWTTAAAIPADAPDPARSLALLRGLMDPRMAALTTAENGFATPNRAARDLLASALRDDPALFPDRRTCGRCHVLADLGPDESRLLAVWAGVRGAATARTLGS